VYCQAAAAAQAGGVVIAILRAEGGSFYRPGNPHSGLHVLVTSNNRQPRAFRNPIKALEVIREIGLQNGRFSREASRPMKPNSIATADRIGRRP